MIDRFSESGLLFYIYAHPDEAIGLFARVPPEKFGSHCRHVARAMLTVAQSSPNLDMYSKVFQEPVLKDLAKDKAAFNVGWKMVFTIDSQLYTKADAERAVQGILEAWRVRGRKYHSGRLLEAAGDRQAYLSVLAELQSLEEQVDVDDLPTVETIDDLNMAQLKLAGSLLGDSLMNEGGLMWIHGQDGVGKTLLALQLAGCMASDGEEWLQYSCGRRPYRVLYLQGELSRQWWQVRTRALKAFLGVNRLETLLFCHSRLVIAKKLSEKRWETSMDWTGLATLGRLVDQHRVEVLFIDPLSSFYGLEENSTDQNREFVNRLLDFRLERGLGMVLVHHDRKQDKFTKVAMRGSSTLRGAGDCSVVIEEMKGGPRVRFDKVRHAPTPSPTKLERTSSGFFVVPGVYGKNAEPKS